MEVRLTKKQRELLELIQADSSLSQAEMAVKLGIHLSTLRNRLTSIERKKLVRIPTRHRGITVTSIGKRILIQSEEST